MTDRARTIVLGSLVAAFCAGAWLLRFVQDDAFISFRYAKHLAEGIGLIWNPGEYVEGYTNFLWTVLVAGGIAAGFDPVPFAQVLGIACSAGSLVVVHRIALAIGLTGSSALVVPALTAMNFSFLSWSTGGLETALATLLCLSGILLGAQLARATANGAAARSRLFAFSAVMAAAMLTRLDSAIVFLPLSVMILFRTIARADRGARLRLIAAGFALPAVICVAWFGWKLAYYGGILPNSFHIKASGSASLDAGLGYLFRFGSSYLMIPFLLPMFLALGAIASRENETVGLVAALAGLWLAYLAAVGGDFMEFRMMVPVIPLLTALVVWSTLRAVRHPVVRTAAWMLCAAGSLHHAATFTYSRDGHIEDVPRLRDHLVSAEENWIGIGRRLGEIFPGEGSVMIAVTAAGAIPYYSRLRAVDMFGLNDPAGEEARTFAGFMPGHQWMTPYDYLVRRGVNLIISHPMVRRTGEPVGGIPIIPEYSPVQALENDPRVVLMEIGFGYSVAMLYLTPDAEVDAALARGELKLLRADEHAGMPGAGPGPGTPRVSSSRR